MKSALIAIALALAGCDKVYDLTRPDIPSDATIDGPPIQVTGTLARLRMDNASNLTPHVATEQPPDAPRVHVGDAPVGVTWDSATGAFEFNGEGGAVSRLLVGDVEVQTRAPTIAIDEIVLGRSGATLIAPADTLDITITMPPILAGTFVASTTGVWSSTFPADDGTNAFSLTWSDMNWSPGQPAARVDGSRRDMLYLHASSPGVGSPPYLRISHESTLPITVTGGSMSATVALVPVSSDACVTISASPADDQTTLDSAVPFPIETSSARWSLLAVPRPDLGIRWQLALAGAVGTENVAQDIHYASLFPSYALLLAVRAEASRVVHGTTVTASATTYRPVVRGTACMPAPLVDWSVPLPSNPRLNGAALTDDMAVQLSTSNDLALAWDLSGGEANEYVVELVELEDGPPHTLRTFRTTEPAIRVDRTLFVPGHTYYFSISALGQESSAVDGDFTHRTPPRAVGTMPTPPFEIM